MSSISFDDNTGNGRAVVCVDGSFVVYTIVHGAVRIWKDESRDAENLPDLKVEPDAEPCDVLVYESFRDVLRKKMGDVMYAVRNVIRDSVLGGIATGGCDVFFVTDSHTGNWRYEIYKDYKANRRKVAHPFDVRRVFNYVVDTLMPNCGILDELGWRRIGVDGVEGDDIVATIIKDSHASVKGIISTDHDYLQLGPKVHIFDIQGKEVLPMEYRGERITHNEAVKCKVIAGDTSDNIPHVFPRVAETTALKKYVRGVDRSVLREALDNDPIAKKQFELNAKLILFSEIPEYVTESIREKVREICPDI